ncbi:MULTISPECIES: hypothetical protein [unclassified Streptomyces]|uniref:hypothetical protein n=1 Tax=unclassified Streptomyces TaxID=2593676 RepID=UPI0033EEF6AC
MTRTGAGALGILNAERTNHGRSGSPRALGRLTCVGPDCDSLVPHSELILNYKRVEITEDQGESMRLRHLATGAAVGAVISAGVITAPAQATSAGAATSCTVTAAVPTYSSPRVYGNGYLRCSSATDAEMSVYVYMDGSPASSGTTVRGEGVSSLADTAAVNNISGNQQWCTFVRAWWDDGTVGDTAYTCENNSW